MFGLGYVLKWLITRKWTQLYLIPKKAVFPEICPLCLSSCAERAVVEKSADRPTNNYVVAQRREWLEMAIPHCSKCAKKLFRSRIIGLGLGGVCIVGAFLLLEKPSGASPSLFMYIAFGYPAYAVATTLQKGVVFGRASSLVMRVYIRDPEYAKRLVALNNTHLGVVTEVPLADNRGVPHKPK
jgi:hypothetical protein